MVKKFSKLPTTDPTCSIPLFRLPSFRDLSQTSVVAVLFVLALLDTKISPCSSLFTRGCFGLGEAKKLLRQLLDRTFQLVGLISHFTQQLSNKNKKLRAWIQKVTENLKDLVRLQGDRSSRGSEARCDNATWKLERESTLDQRLRRKCSDVRSLSESLRLNFTRSSKIWSSAMGGCVGTTRHGSGGRGSRRPSGFSESTSSALHTTHTKNKPLRRDKIRLGILSKGPHDH